MRVEIFDAIMYRHSIDSSDPELVGKWFAEKAEMLMSDSAQFNHPVQMDIWPSTEQEHLIIGQWSIRPVTQDSLLEFARHILNAAERLGEIERNAAV